MKKSTIYLKAATNVVLYIVVATLIIVFLPKIFGFFMPFVIGWLISAIANPAVRFFEVKIKFKRKAMSAVFIVLIIALIILAGYGIVVFLVDQFAGLVDSLPEKWPRWQESFNRWGTALSRRTEKLPENMRETFENLGSTLENSISTFVTNLATTGAGAGFMQYISQGIGSIANVLVGIIMAVLSAYFLTVEHNNIAEAMEKYCPKSAYSQLMAAYRGLKNAVGGYFKAQFNIELWVYLITIIGLLISRVEYAAVITLGICFMDFLPFFGAGIIMVPWSVIAFMNGDYWVAVGVFITWGVGQLVRQLIQPKIMGDKVGLAPLPTLVILYIGYKFSSVIGMIVAIPVAMIVISLGKEGVFNTFINSIKILWNGLSGFRHLSPEEEKISEKD